VIEGRTERGESGTGAWYATAPDGRPVVLKWVEADARERFEILTRSTDELRSRGYPVPVYRPVVEHGDRLVVVQERLDGRIDVAVNERTVTHVLALNELQAGVEAPIGIETWGEFMIRTLTVGEVGWAEHGSLRTHSDRTRALLEIIEAIGAETDPSSFPSTGIVHLDLHPGNLLLADDGSVTGVVDWEGATSGDHRFDLTSFAFCHRGGVPFVGGFDDSQSGEDAIVEPIWQLLETTMDPLVLRAYAAHQSLRLVDWMIRHHPADAVTVWLDASETLLGRLG
jgi:Ser/Thr protein kinase RdoA (MazF antagonist)